MTMKQGLLAATMLALPLAAQAQQPVSGLYVGAGAGVNFRQEPDVTFSTGNLSLGLGKLETKDVGGVGLAAIGYGFGNGLRAEVEGNYRFNEVSGGGRGTAIGGYLRTYGAMANVLYDFVGLGIPVVPYIGVGAGAAVNELDDVIFRSATSTGSSTTQLKSNTWEFAYQAILGLAYSLDSMVPGLALTAEYRFFGTLDANAKAVVTNRNAAGAITSGGASGNNFDVTNYNHSLLLGVRYNFGQAAPAPVVAPAAPAAPAIARTYLVFFDWDRADLTERAKQIIAEAAANAPKVQTTRIEVSGHADRSGSAQYNQRLSQRRADTVAAELVRLGIQRSQIVVQAFGESRPLVPTADGVREPQNRRVEIVLR